MTTSLTDTQLFTGPLGVRISHSIAVGAFEDLQLCLRYALASTNSSACRERQPEQWFATFLRALQSLRFSLFEHTHEQIVYDAHRHIISDVYNGHLPPPRERGPWFGQLEHLLKQASVPDSQYKIRVHTCSSHLCIDFDCEEDGVPVAILFHIYCTNDPAAPAGKVNLVFNHLGARASPTYLAGVRESLQMTIHRQLQAALTSELG